MNTRCLFMLLLLAGSFSILRAQNVSLVGHINYQSLHDAILNDCWGYVDEVGNEYALVGTTKGTSVVNLTDPANPVEIAWFPGTESIWRDLQVWDDYAYITTEAEDGLLIIDLSPLPASTTLPSAIYMGEAGSPWQSAHDLFIDASGYAYICGANRGNGGLIILDVHTNPMAPVEVGEFDNWYCHDAFAQGNLLYGAHIADGFLSIIDITDRSNPVLINTKQTPNSFTHNIWVTSDDQYAVTTDEVPGAYLALYDVSDPMSIQETDRIQSSPGLEIIPHNAFIKNDSLIISSYYTDGITIHDMSRPHNLVQVGGYDTHPAQTSTFDGSWGVYPFLPSGLLLASDRSEGLFVLEPTYIKPGYYEGLVRNASTLDPLEGVKVSIGSNPQIDFSDVAGEWAVGTATSGTQVVTFYKVAYYPQTINIDFSAGQLILDTIDLVPIPPFSLTVIVEEQGTSNPLIGADVRISRPEMDVEDQTNGFGERQFQLYYSGMTTVTVGKWGYRTSCSDLTIDGTTGTLTVQLEKGYYDDFSFDFGWVATDDDAESGLWERGIPEGSNSLNTPYEDVIYDCGAYAYVTGNGRNISEDFDDVDKGRVTLYSPQFNLSGEADTYIHYSRWFYCFSGPEAPDDTLEIYLAAGFERVLIDKALPDMTNYATWFSRGIRVSDYMTPQDNMQLVVTVADENPRVNITEAGLDRFFISNQNEVGIEEDQNENQQEVVVYPNPVRNQLYLVGVENGEAILVSDPTGKTVMQTTVQSGSVDCSQLVSGVYFLQTVNEVVRFVKQ